MENGSVGPGSLTQECIRVACRVRPAANPSAPRIWVTHDNVVQAVVQQGDMVGRGGPSPTKLLQHEMPSFSFERVFNETERNKEVYDSFCRTAVDKAIAGCKASLLLYGQTNAGKTHTISGSGGEPGVFHHAVHDIFSAAAGQRRPGFACSLAVVAIYNERALDMLHPGAPEPLNVVGPGMLRNRSRGSVTLQPLTSAEDALQTFRIAELRRHYAATLKNAHSSRSHTIFMLHVDMPAPQQPPPPTAAGSAAADGQTQGVDSEEHGASEAHDEGGAEALGENGAGRPIGEGADAAEAGSITSGCLYLVDLAGSESTKETGSTGSRKREAENINRSLLALTEVLSQLSRNNGGLPPYRRSALTRVLQPCLGHGSNAFAAMLFCIDPLNLHVSEKTLKYGVMTKVIRIRYGINLLKQQQDDDAMVQIDKLKKELNFLRSENRKLEEQRLSILIMWRKGWRPWVPGWQRPDDAANLPVPTLAFRPEDFPADLDQPQPAQEKEPQAQPPQQQAQQVAHPAVTGSEHRASPAPGKDSDESESMQGPAETPLAEPASTERAGEGESEKKAVRMVDVGTQVAQEADGFATTRVELRLEVVDPGWDLEEVHDKTIPEPEQLTAPPTPEPFGFSASAMAGAVHSGGKDSSGGHLKEVAFSLNGGEMDSPMTRRERRKSGSSIGKEAVVYRQSVEGVIIKHKPRRGLWKGLNCFAPVPPRED